MGRSRSNRGPRGAGEPRGARRDRDGLEERDRNLSEARAAEADPAQVSESGGEPKSARAVARALPPKSESDLEDVRERSSGALPGREFALFVAAFTLLAALLRLTDLNRTGLWFDEIHTLTESAFPRAPGGPHPLFYRLDRFFASLLSDETAGVRLYPALAGVAAIPAIALLAGRAASPAAGVVAAALLCMQPFHLMHSGEGRFYAPMVLFSILQFLGGLLAFEGSGRPAVRNAAGLALAGFAWWMGAGNHPTALPFAMGHALALGLAIPPTRRGMELVLEATPPALHPKRPRLALAGGVLGLGVVAALVAGDLRRQALKVLTEAEWGATPGVDFAPRFFAEHLAEFGWDFRRFGGEPWLSAAATAALAVVGFVRVARARPWFAIQLVVAPATVLLAVFAFHRPDGYFPKYVAYVQAPLLLCVAAGAARLVEPVFRWIARLRPDARPRIAHRVALIGTIALAILPTLPAAWRVRTMPTMPLRSQFAWLDRNVLEGSHVFLYGHVGFPAALYRDRLSGHHRLHYLPWVEDDGRLEIEMMRGAAATGRPTFFAHAWPRDVPSALLAWLEANADVAVRIASIRGPEYDGILYRLRPPNDDEHARPTRPARAIDAMGRLGRPRVVASLGAAEGNEDALRFSSAGWVGYRHDLRAGRDYLVEMDVAAALDGAYFLTAAADRGRPLPVGENLRAGEVVRWALHLRPERDAELLRLYYASDYAIPDLDRALDVLSVTVRPWREGDAEAARIPFGAFANVGYPWAPDGVPMSEWSFSPPETFVPRLVPGEEFARVRVGKIPRDQPVARIISPQVSLEPDHLVFVRVRVRMNEAFGLGATLAHFLADEKGEFLGRVAVAMTSLGSRVDWDPWTGEFAGTGWAEFQNILSMPTGTAWTGIGVQVWESAGQRRIEDAANEIQIAPVEIAILRPRK